MHVVIDEKVIDTVAKPIVHIHMIAELKAYWLSC